MGFLDVLSGKQSLGNWITGRSPDEEYIYNNEEGVAAAAEYFNDVAVNKIPEAQSAINVAIEELNSLPGIDGCFPATLFDDAFTSITGMVNELGTTMQQKGDDIIAYGDADFGTRFAATLGMTLAKPAEGFLSVFEDIGDGALSIVGFGAGLLGMKDAQNSIGNFVKKDLSHDVFQYDKWAKYSAYTEDSALAGGLKLVGKTAGYLYAGGAMAGLGSSLGVGGTKLGTAALKLGSSTTWGATAAGFIGGVGSGTAAGLQSGMDYNQAFGQGLKTGGIQAAFAFGGGKVGEKLSKMSAVKHANKVADKADDVLDKATKAMDEADDAFGNAKQALENNTNDATEGLLKKTYDKALQDAKDARTVLNNADEAAVEAHNAVNVAENAKYEGFDDIFTRKGYDFGKSTGDTLKSGARAFQKTASASHAVRKGSIDANQKVVDATAAQKAFRADARTLITKNNPVAQGISGAKGAVAALKNGGASLANTQAKDVVPKLVAGAKDAARSAPKVIADGVRAGAPIAPAAAYNEHVKQTGNTPHIQRSTPTSETSSTPPATGSPPPPSPDPVPTPYNGTPNGEGLTGGNPGGSNPGGRNPGGGGGGYKTMPTTSPSSTVKPTTVQPTTVQPTTVQPTTVQPTTVQPTTIKPQPAPTTGGRTPTPIPSNGENRSVTPPTSNGGGSTHGGYEYGSTGVVGGQPGNAAASLADLIDDSSQSIDDIIKGSKYSRIPTSSKPIAASGGSSSVIPIAAGLTAASAAGLGAKAYMDYRRSKEDDEEEDEEEDYVNAIDQDDLVVDGWTEEDDDSYNPEGETEFINIDKQDEDEYYRESESPVPIVGTEELEEF